MRWGGSSEKSDSGKTQVYCIEDGDLIPPEGRSPEWYQHGDHGYQRALVFDPGAKWEFRDDGELRHFSAGVILWQQQGQSRRYCLARRRRHPIGYYTIPAGHLDMGESFSEAAMREAYEETQLGITSMEVLIGGDHQDGLELNDECRRGSNYHVWSLYLCQCVGEPRLSDEGDVIGWFTREEIINTIKLNKPSGVFFEELFGEKPHHVRDR